ncbi:adenine-specific DNA-methyltransferase [Chryseobacterium carnipullorum]|uniref:site-specific DNA-methyltransferase n=1 Tax=Chryseobacterium carnipullorum TaxID=1124835 RepID=UPI00091FA951|nr:site-specific DNA-methyltransferase [Chryseobacterium carnipullorum]SHL53136.1 adenine-specific DNA-methyltransferase [Chryseobacterium carnipullorum]
MEKINELTSENIVQQNIERLKEIFPTAFSEGKLVVEELQALVGEYIQKDKEYYQMTWAGKTEAQREANKVSTGTLRPSKDESKDWDSTGNIFIEGDNLEVLKLLQKTYNSKIKMIYIDPPYNTGKDFVYEDDFSDNLKNYLELTGQTDQTGKKLTTNTDNDGRFHSKWLTNMYPRLKLARNLLSDNGIIFISIDDHEQGNLKKICNEIFGEENFISQLVWKSGGTSSAHFTKEHEYVLCYSKNLASLSYFQYNGISSVSDRAIKKPSVKNPISIIHFPAGIDFECEDKIFPNFFGDKEPVKIVSGIFQAKNRKLANEVSIEAAWSMADMIKNWLNGLTVIDQKGQIVKRFFFKNNGVLQYEKEKGTIHPKTIITDYTTKQGSNSILNLFENNYFDFPKPPDLIKYFSSIVTNDSDIILDFFAGSGTTAHAVMQLNAEDGGSRKCISVQLPELTDEKSEAYKAGYKNIAEITKERIRRAGELITRENKDKEGIENLDTGFRVFKLDSSNILAWDTSVDEFEGQLDMFAENNGDHIKSNRTEEDVLFEILLKYGLELTLPIEEKVVGDCKIYNIGFGSMYICLSDQIKADVATTIGEWHKESSDSNPSVIFKDSGFASDADKTNTVQTLRQVGIENVKSI